MEASNAPTIAACGYFDTIDFDSQIRLRVLRNELLRRIPGVEFHVFAPFGAIRRVAMAAAEVVEALCPITDERTEQFLNDFDLVVRVAASEGAQPRYTDHPIPNPADCIAADAFLTAPPGRIVVDDPRVPHPGIVYDRVFPFALCEQRVAFLRAMQWWPQDRAAVVIDASDLSFAGIESLCALHASSGMPVVINQHFDNQNHADHDAGDATTWDAIDPAHASLEDLVAALACAKVVVSDDSAVRAVATAYGVEVRTISRSDFGSDSDFNSAAQRGNAISTLDAAYDAIARQVVNTPRKLIVDAEIQALRAALTQHQQRLAHERVVFADYVNATRNVAASQVAQARESRTILDKIAARFWSRD